MVERERQKRYSDAMLYLIGQSNSRGEMWAAVECADLAEAQRIAEVLTHIDVADLYQTEQIARFDDLADETICRHRMTTTAPDWRVYDRPVWRVSHQSAVK